MSSEVVEDVIYPPTPEAVADLRAHNVGLAIRLAARLGRPLSDWEYAMFEKEPPERSYALVELPGGGLGVA
ncbi:MAG: hypothetical protein LBK42_14595 [Propionibacteriaceae bacterium]|jgi:hypothetical protein|nr:hypothetical protein [Propionibacteriaceae bacterium]